MASQDHKANYLEKIVNSEIFRDKELYTTLLRYLVSAAFEGIAPKEVTVAQDVFHKGKDFNTSEDATVRVHMHNLRHKLEQYYQTEGSSDALRIHIPKGHYKVEYIKKSDATSTRKRDEINIPPILLSLVIALLSAYIVIDKFIIEKRYSYFEFNQTNNQLWSHFFSNDLPASIVIGDFLIFHEYHAALDRPRRIMDYEINTDDELDEYIMNHPENYPEAWNLGELPHNSIYNIIDIQPLFQSFAKELRIRFSTEIDINIIKDSNLIYIGEFKNLRALSDLVATLPIKYETLPWWHGTISWQQKDSLVTLSTSRDWEKSRYVTDLGIFVKVPGQNDENYVIIAGFGYNAQVKIVELVSHIASLQLLEQQIEAAHKIFPDYFVAVFEVQGFDRASTTAEMKFFSIIDKEQYLAGFVPRP